MNFSGEVRLAVTATEGQPTQSTLSVGTFGLPPANPYTVSVTKRSDGSTLVLGTLTVHFGVRWANARRGHRGQGHAAGGDSQRRCRAVFSGTAGRRVARRVRPRRTWPR